MPIRFEVEDAFPVRPAADLNPPKIPGGDLHLLLAGFASGGVIADAGHARAAAELLLEHRYGRAELERQRPLIVEDAGNSWRVEGSWNRERKTDPADPLQMTFGPFHVLFWKHDGRVLDYGVPGIMEPDPGAMRRIRRHLKRLHRDALNDVSLSW
jgi:hypothetical protein